VMMFFSVSRRMGGADRLLYGADAARHRSSGALRVLVTAMELHALLGSTHFGCATASTRLLRSHHSFTWLNGFETHLLSSPDL
jgi:hypothetical protein